MTTTPLTRGPKVSLLDGAVIGRWEPRGHGGGVLPGLSSDWALTNGACVLTACRG